MFKKKKSFDPELAGILYSHSLGYHSVNMVKASNTGSWNISPAVCLGTEGSRFLMNHLLHTRNYNLIAEYMITPNNLRVLLVKKMGGMDIG